MSVLDGPRREQRRILVDGAPQWCEPDGEMLALPDGRRVREAEAVYLPPCEPSKILCVHLNFRSRAVEFGRDLEGETPTYFAKPASALNAHGGQLVRPTGCHWLNYEGEIAAIVGRTLKNASREQVWDHLAGFSPANDIGAHDFRDTDAGSMLRVKGMDGFCPVGPGVVRGLDPRQSTLRTYLNGEVVQDAPVSEMVWGIDYLLADLSRHITLLPGDVVLTGTPGTRDRWRRAMSSRWKSTAWAVSPTPSSKGPRRVTPSGTDPATARRSGPSRSARTTTA